MCSATVTDSLGGCADIRTQAVRQEFVIVLDVRVRKLKTKTYGLCHYLKTVTKDSKQSTDQIFHSSPILTKPRMADGHTDLSILWQIDRKTAPTLKIASSLGFSPHSPSPGYIMQQVFYGENTVFYPGKLF